MQPITPSSARPPLTPRISNVAIPSNTPSTPLTSLPLPQTQPNPPNPHVLRLPPASASVPSPAHPSPPQTFTFPPFSLSNGLVEIAALTTIIGSKNAEALTLGARGAAGLPWAMLSSFGALSVVRACLAASTPEVLRETFGLRNAATDGAVGLRRDLRRGRRAVAGMVRERRELGAAVGVVVAGRQTSSDDELNAVPQIDESTVKWMDIYALDQYTQRLVQSCPFTTPPQPLAVSLYSFDVHADEARRIRAFQDYMSIFVSAVKLIEVYILWRCGDTPLFWVTALPWLFAFLAAPVLQMCHMSRPRLGRDQVTQLDILSGSLPTPQVPGGQHRLLLGAPQNVRHHRAWRVIWAISALIGVATLISSYVLLSKEAQTTVYIWIGFQTLWLILRSAFYHLAESADNPIQQSGARPLGTLGKSPFIGQSPPTSSPPPPPASSRRAPPPRRLRHPLPHAFRPLPPQPPNLPDGAPLDVTITAILGDTLLSSASWFLGSGPTSSELYDSCLLELVLPHGQAYLVPCARVLSGPPKGSAPKDSESSVVANFAPRGGSNDPDNITWWYWIPCAGARWLRLRSEGAGFLGKRRGGWWRRGR
ncbi:MAG: hypothetical protein FRX48_09385 [Lasallia pustulata]|uniref:Uncharacterized protein n=1 Tax=Lasallia pustulata TaxID=136370 RepID=A0A5M8PC68_9LECA|nr:MAG: hypothetical protein FRX48_09385 [Lasallia pustulata]